MKLSEWKTDKTGQIQDSNRYVTLTPYLERDGKFYYLNALSTIAHTKRAILKSLDTSSAVEYTANLLSNMTQDRDALLNCEISFFIDEQIEQNKDFRPDLKLLPRDVLPSVNLLSISYKVDDDVINRKSFIVNLEEYFKSIQAIEGLTIRLNSPLYRFYKTDFSTDDFNTLTTPIFERGLEFTPRIVLLKPMQKENQNQKAI